MCSGKCLMPTFATRIINGKMHAVPINPAIATEASEKLRRDKAELRAMIEGNLAFFVDPLSASAAPKPSANPAPGWYLLRSRLNASEAMWLHQTGIGFDKWQSAEGVAYRIAPCPLEKLFDLDHPIEGPCAEPRHG